MMSMTEVLFNCMVSTFIVIFRKRSDSRSISSAAA